MDCAWRRRQSFSRARGRRDRMSVSGGRMKELFAAAVLALGTVALAAEDTKLGAGVTLKESTPIKALIETPADYVGKTIRVDGVATAVCENMGCWMAVAADDEKDAKDAKTVRLKVEDGVFVFPVSAKG